MCWVVVQQNNRNKKNHSDSDFLKFIFFRKFKNLKILMCWVVVQQNNRNKKNYSGIKKSFRNIF